VVHGQQATDSRVLVLSQRCLSRDTWHAAQYELEDLLADLDDVRLLAPLPAASGPAHGAAHRLGNGVRRRTGLARRRPLWPARPAQPAPVRTSHELFFAVFHHSHQLAYLHAVPGWRERCTRAACLLVELWTPGLGDDDYLSLLRGFDVVYVCNPYVVEPLRAAGLREVRYLHPGVDALAMQPAPHWPERVLDVYSYGRRSPSVHRALLDLSAATGLTYVFDSLQGGSLGGDHREHRALLAALLARARTTVVHTINDSDERRARTGGDEALTTRYFEAAAAGAVVLGSRPDSAVFDDAFPWPDAVVDLPYGSTDVAPVLAALDADPDRTAAVRAASVSGSLRRHDWAHRWHRVLQDVGLPSTPALEDRREALEQAAAALSAEDFLPRRGGAPAPGTGGATLRRDVRPGAGADGGATHAAR
jgi:hypothetical protein